MTQDPIIVVGGGLAAATLATAYRDAGGERPLAILAAEPDPPYNRPPLTKGFLRGELEREATLVRAPAELRAGRIELRLGTPVVGLHPGEHEVELAGGERVAYGTLVLATGARPRDLPVPGADRVGVHTFRTLADAESVRATAAEARRAIVIGGSFIGAEAAASLRLSGLDVTLVELGPMLMPQLRAPELSEELAALYREHGVELLLGTGLEELTGDGQHLTGARTADGQHVEGSLAVVGIGVVPNVELAEAAGAEVDHGVVVDERFRTSLADVYAIGDVARFPDPVSGRLRRIEHWSNASAHGTHLGRQLAGSEAPYDELPVFFTQLFDRKLQVLGDVEVATTCVLRGSLSSGRLLGFHLADGLLVGAVVHGQEPEVVAELGALLRERPLVEDVARLADEHLSPAVAVGA